MAAAGSQQRQEELDEALIDQMGQLDVQDEEEEDEEEEDEEEEDEEEEDEEEEDEVVTVLDLQAAQEYEVDLTLDPDTAHPKLILSDDGKQVRCGDERQTLQDGPRRFNHCLNVLAEQRFSTRFYFEVQVRGKTGWTIGVARESINRKGVVKVSPRRGCWAMRLRNENQYTAQANPPVLLPLGRGPEKVGVFVDYEQGLVSFYNAGTEGLIYSFTGCDFSERLYPFFSPGPNDRGRNSAPLVISPVTD